MCLCIIGTDWNSMIMSMSKLYHPDCILTAVTCIVSGQWCSFEQNALRPLNFLNKCHCKDLVRCTLSCLFFISSAAFDIWNVFAHLLLFKCRTSCAKHSFLCAPTQMYNLSWLFVLWWFYCRWLYCQAVFECPKTWDWVVEVFNKWWIWFLQVLTVYSNLPRRTRQPFIGRLVIVYW